MSNVNILTPPAYWGDWSEGSYSVKLRSWKKRVVVWFSCGATSAIAAKLALMRYGTSRPVEIMYFDTGGEHESNHVFLRQCEEWLGHPIRMLKNEKYRDHFDVFEKRKTLGTPQGTPCTTFLKRKMRIKYSNPIEDIQVFGFDVDERRRVDSFRSNNEDVYLEVPLIVEGITKNTCKAILQNAGIDLPMMYLPQKSGQPYDHANCIGCPKGGMGYWNKIRIDFPDVFERMASLEERLGRTVLLRRGEQLYLRDLEPDAGRNKPIPPISCDIMCQSLTRDFEDE